MHEEHGLPAPRRLSRVPELLDGPLDDATALDGNLRDLRRINRYLGGTAISARAIEALVPRGRPGWSLLDVGTGAADIPATLIRSARAAGRSVSIVGLDTRPEVIAAAHRVDPGLRAIRELELVVADGRHLPYPDRAFDVVHSSLLVHHLEPADAVAALREQARVARLGIVVNDLVRARRHWLAARALVAIATRNRFTRHDAPLSVRRAYTRVELRALVAAAGMRPVLEAHALLGHRVAIAAVAIDARQPDQRSGTPPGANDPM